MIKWEYKLFALSSDLQKDIIDQLNKEGELGWELANVLQSRLGGKNSVLTAIVKRPLEENAKK